MNLMEILLTTISFGSLSLFIFIIFKFPDATNFPHKFKDEE